MTNINNIKNTTISDITLKCIREFNKEHSKLFPNHDNNNWWWNFEYFRLNTDGSFTCKASQEALNVAETQSLAIAILWEDDIEAQLVGDDGSMGNYEMYTPIYIPKIGLAFLIPYGISDQFARGKEVTIQGYEPTKEELYDMIEWSNQHS